MTDELAGRVALVTGASGGIGGAIARALHGCGAAVGLSGTRDDRLKALAAELGDRTAVLPCDLGDRDAVAALPGEVVAALGSLDVLVNNAGLHRDMLAMRMSDAEWDEVLDIDLGAAFRLSRAAMRGMMRARWGRIINITSVVGHAGNPGQANYAAAKGGLAAMTKSLAVELASRGITVNCVAPGMIDTAMTERLGDEQRSRILAAVPMARMGTGDEVAAAVAFLATPGAAYITGQTLHVNGGMAMY